MSNSNQPSPREIDLMRQALALAADARGLVEPNPMVGCIIHKAGRIIGTGIHQRFGEAHAEPNALVTCTESPAGATAVVSLEPCCHTEKKTPPCVPALIAAGIARVVVGCLDPNPGVAGQGVAQLRAAGIEVVTDVLRPECQQLNSAFFALMREHRPYVTLKWAQTADGSIAGPGGRPLRISSPESTRFVHHLRTRCDAIVVSADTVISDDPQLTVRDVSLIRRPAPVVVDSHLRTPEMARVLRSEQTLVFTAASGVAPGRAQTVQVRQKAGHIDLPVVFAELGRRNMTHALIEPGPRLAQALIARNLADRIIVIQSPSRLTYADAPQAANIPFAANATMRLGQDRVTEYLNPASRVFFAPTPSADFRDFG